jgi:hypothetical protein
MKSDVVTHTDEENTAADDVLDHKIAETTTDREISNSTVCVFFVTFIDFMFFIRKLNLHHLNRKHHRNVIENQSQLIQRQQRNQNL